MRAVHGCVARPEPASRPIGNKNRTTKNLPNKSAGSYFRILLPSFVISWRYYGLNRVKEDFVNGNFDSLKIMNGSNSDLELSIYVRKKIQDLSCDAVSLRYTSMIICMSCFWTIQSI